MSTAPTTVDRSGDRAAARPLSASLPRVSLRPFERHRASRLLAVARLADTAVAILILLTGFLASNLHRLPVGFQEFLELRLTLKNLFLVLGFAVAWRLLCTVVGLYDPRVFEDPALERRRVLAAVTAGSMVALVFPLISVTHAFDYLAVVYFWFGAVAGMLVLRGGIRALWEAGAPKAQDVLIVGSGPRALAAFHELSAAGDRADRVLGFVDSADGETAPEVRQRLIGDLDGLEEILMRRAVDEVIIALPARSHYAEIQRAIEICERGGVPARYPSDIFQHQRRSDPGASSDPFAIPAGRSRNDPRSLVKRCADLVLAAAALVAVTPILAVAALAIKLTSPGPVIFTQERYGLNKRRFRMYKLRTMVADAESRQATLEAANEASGPVFKIRSDPRITPVGRVLRRLSIDELPQLVNVFQGDMSLVGPRPLPARDVSRFTEPALMRRFSVHPGITGLWQVSGRSELDFDDWVKLDLQYIDEWSLGLDLRILMRTVPTVFRGTGAV